MALETAIILGFAPVLVAIWAIWQSEKRAESNATLPLDRPELPYKAFTKQFDAECSGDELEDVVFARAVDHRRGKSRFKSNQECLDAYRLARTASLASLAKLDEPDLSGTAIMVLIDQSGSMAERMAWVAGEIEAAGLMLEGLGASVCISAFTTMGWLGGRSRKAWIDAGRPEYPGRLCDLLHIIYKPFHAKLEEGSLARLATTHAMFENVDGEALIWARDSLMEEVADERRLIIISDGAPVDDSTLSANGPNILWRDLQNVILQIERNANPLLCAVGIEHDVATLYSCHRRSDKPGELAPALLDLVSPTCS